MEPGQRHTASRTKDESQKNRLYSSCMRILFALYEFRVAWDKSLSVSALSFANFQRIGVLASGRPFEVATKNVLPPANYTNGN